MFATAIRPIRAAAVETLEQRQLLASIPLGEIGLGYREDFAIPHGTTSYTFTLDKPTTVDASLRGGNVTLKRLGLSP